MIQNGENQDIKQAFFSCRLINNTEGWLFCVLFFAQNPISMPIS